MIHHISYSVNRQKMAFFLPQRKQRRHGVNPALSSSIDGNQRAEFPADLRKFSQRNKNAVMIYKI
ncbi:hypothetical protein DRW42_20665 [Pedobacter miscanthi]|uniref:Uncharacterized protein n=1 Tax=Pedobacter miscanthi TaxID=2259170 RepID=A0A366KPN5_9SPHI|nr:hypothetical protein DRW42_20665 [Pedobacter miscanthi]